MEMDHEAHLTDVYVVPTLLVRLVSPRLILVNISTLSRKRPPRLRQRMVSLGQDLNGIIDKPEPSSKRSLELDDLERRSPFSKSSADDLERSSRFSKTNADRFSKRNADDLERFSGFLKRNADDLQCSSRFSKRNADDTQVDMEIDEQNCTIRQGVEVVKLDLENLPAQLGLFVHTDMIPFKRITMHD
jgi:hypothetical protein